MNKFKICVRGMQGISIAVIAFGVLMALFNATFLAPVLNSLFDHVFWPSEVLSEGTGAFKHWVESLLGAMMVAWGLLLWGITRHAFAKRELWAWNTILVSTLGWFIIDESFSVYYRVWVNVIGNLPLFGVLMLILVLTRREMK